MTWSESGWLIRVVVGTVLIAGLGVLSGCGGVDGPPPPPASFLLTSPVSTTTTTVGASPRLIWTDATGETSYTVQISTSPTFSTYYNILATANTTSHLITAPSPSLLLGTQYYWQVLATNSSGVTKAANAPFTFIP